MHHYVSAKLRTTIAVTAVVDCPVLAVPVEHVTPMLSPAVDQGLSQLSLWRLANGNRATTLVESISTGLITYVSRHRTRQEFSFTRTMLVWVQILRMMYVIHLIAHAVTFKTGKCPIVALI